MYSHLTLLSKIFASNAVIVPVNTVSAYLLLSFVLFCLSLFGALVNCRNIIIFLACIELMLLASGINFVAFGVFGGHVEGQVFAILLLAAAAAKVAIGLGILLVYFRRSNSVG